MPNQNSPNALWRLPTVESETGLSKSEIYRRVKLNTFPKPIKLGARAVAWSAASIQQWIKDVIQGGAK